MLRLHCLLIALVPVLGGCLLYTRNVTGSHNSDYREGSLYELKADATLTQREKRMWLEEATLDLPRYALMRPAYAASSGDGIVATVPAGTQVRFDRLVYFYFFEGDQVLPVARITNGPHKGREVEVRDISAASDPEAGFSHRTRVDPAWLKVVGAP